jgi:DnaJ-class molecular chaperone
MSIKSNKSKSKFNPYEILDVEKNADRKTIEKKFKKLAVIAHPDKNKNDPNANENFQLLSKAKDILINNESREKYDKYGITDEQDEMKINQEMMQEMMLKQRLRDVLKLSITLSEALNGFKRKLNLKREVICSIQRKQSIEDFEIILDIDSTKPLNKPIIFEGKGKKYDNITGDLVIILNIKPDNTYKINKSNFNLVTKHKISIVESLCGFTIDLPYSDKNIKIQYHKIINPNNVYIIEKMGLTIVDESGELLKSNIEIHFDIQYKDQLTHEQTEKIKDAFGYNYIKPDINKNDNKIYNITEHIHEQESENEQNSEIFEQMFGSIPGNMGSNFPFGIPGGIPGDNGSSRIFTSQSNTQECKMQ